MIVLDLSFMYLERHKVPRCGGLFELLVVHVKCLKPSATVIVAVWHLS